MLLAAQIGLCAFVLVNFAYSLRLAYVMALNANDGGYPIFGHAVHNFFALSFVWILLPRETPLQIKTTAIVALLAVPFLNGCLINYAIRRGGIARQSQS